VALFRRVVWALALLLVSRMPSVAQAQAQAEAKVWVNTRSGVYHCPGTRYYGTTKAGTFMAEAEARAAGHHPTHGARCSPMVPTATGAPDSVGASATVVKARPLAATATSAAYLLDTLGTASYVGRAPSTRHTRRTPGPQSHGSSPPSGTPATDAEESTTAEPPRPS
jgi:hypothetical protein